MATAPSPAAPSPDVSTAIEKLRKQGFTVVDESADRTVLVRPKQFSRLLCLLWLFWFGLGAALYVIYFVVRPDDEVVVRVDGSGRSRFAWTHAPRRVAGWAFGGALWCGLSVVVWARITGAWPAPEAQPPPEIQMTEGLGVPAAAPRPSPSRSALSPIPQAVSSVAGQALQVASDRVAVPGGTFTMGSNSGDPDEAPTHRVSVSSFHIDRTEVSVAQYLGCAGAGNCTRPTTTNRCAGTNANAAFPVVCVSWFDATAYCSLVGGRLPTEAEWEYAARGADGRAFPWGSDSPDCSRADFTPTDNAADSCNGTGPSPVGSRPAGASPFGVLDLAGNVYEWVADWHDPAYYLGSPAASPTGPVTGRRRIARGGTWGSPWVELRTSERRAVAPEVHQPGVGFRCVYP